MNSAQCEGEEVEIGFNNRYLLDALRNARTEQVKLEISGPLSPVKVLPTEGMTSCIWSCLSASKTTERRKNAKDPHPYRIYQAGRPAEICRSV